LNFNALCSVIRALHQAVDEPETDDWEVQLIEILSTKADKTLSFKELFTFVKERFKQPASERTMSLRQFVKLFREGKPV